MKTKEDIKNMIELGFPDLSNKEKERMVDHLFEQERRLSIFRSKTIKPYKDALILTKPFVDSEIRKINNSKTSRALKQRIVTQALKMIFIKYPKIKKTPSSAWIKFDHIENQNIYDPLTGETCRVYIKGDKLFIVSDNRKKPFKPYAKRSLQPFIDALK